MFNLNNLFKIASVITSVSKVVEESQKHKRTVTYTTATNSKSTAQTNHQFSDAVREIEAQLLNLKTNFSTDAAISENVSKYQDDIARIKATLQEAENFQNQLDMASRLYPEKQAGYERAQIHSACEARLGHGNPKSIINKQMHTLQQIKNDLTKLQRRAEELQQKASRKIEKLVIDGSNCCYAEGTLVGIRPLISLTDHLKEKYEIVIVFDGSIRKKLGLSDEQIRQCFSKNITIHVTPSKQAADDTLLQLAENEPNSYIISNDRFGEYQEKSAVTQNRLLKHNIVDGKFIINDLDVNIVYA